MRSPMGSPYFGDMLDYHWLYLLKAIFVFTKLICGICSAHDCTILYAQETIVLCYLDLHL